MKMFFKIKFNKKNPFFIKYPEILTENSFRIILFLFLISLLFSSFIYYKYFFLAQNLKPSLINGFEDFKKENFQGVLSIWEEKEKRFQEVEFKNYQNPFKEQLTDK